MTRKMKRYIGTKIVDACPMNRLQYNNYRDWDMPADEEGSDEGYLVEYLNGGKPCHPDHRGYISWSPKSVFIDSYKELDDGVLGFSGALSALKHGARVARKGWNGKDMFLFLVPGSRFAVNRPPLLGIYEEGAMIDYHAHIDMKTAQGDVVPWLASQTDMLAEDWLILD